MKKGLFIFITLLLVLNFLPAPLSFGEVPDKESSGKESSDKNKDRTILLNTSAIQGDRLEEEKEIPLPKKRADLPALSTALRWEGNAMIELDIPKEILDQLTQPDLSYILDRGSDLGEID